MAGKERESNAKEKTTDRMQLYRDELNALLIHPDPSFSSSYRWAWISGSPDAPALNRLIEQACRDADNASMLDVRISTLLSVVTNDPAIERVGASELKNKVYKNGELIGLIAISDKFIERPNLTSEMFLAVLTHECKHDSHVDFVDASVTEKRKMELDADSAAADTLQMINYLLSLAPQQSVKNHDFEKENETDYHPRGLTRIETSLEKLYGVSIFKSSGQFDFDGDDKHESYSFNPRRWQMSKYVTENGRVITNWDSDLAPAIQNQVKLDISHLKHMLENGLTDTERNTFIQTTYRQVVEFRQEHLANIELPSNAYLANQFEASLNSNSRHVTVESVKAMHSGMESAYKVLNEISRYADHFVSESARTTFFDMGKQHLINNMRMGVFPDTPLECNATWQQTL